MNHHYILPVGIAIASHAALFFGFTKNPHPPATPGEKTVLFRFEVSPPKEEPPVPVESDHSDAVPKAAPDVPTPPRSAEPPTIDIGPPPTMTPPPLSTLNARDISQVFAHSLGEMDGKGSNPWGNGIIASTLLDNSPRTRFQATPMYPFQAKRDGLRGEVVVEFLVDERGRVIDPRVLSSTNQIFNEASLRAVAKWQFEPGRRDGRIVRFRMAAPIVFNLSE